jgi:hypothetical protein
MPKIEFFLPGDQEFDGDIGEIIAPIGTDLAHGEPVRIIGRNAGDTVLRNISMSAASTTDEARVELAAKENLWAEPGQEIFCAEELKPGEEFSFWVRGLYSPSDAEQILPFELVIRGLSVGA